ncbi:MAG: CoA-binding protein [Actinobacteria bacterium]|nr:CoA-binding protein [Actinomycetota bacterium]
MKDLYNNIFYPKTVAVVGASPKETNVGRNIVENITEWEYEGDVFPVNPEGEDVYGYKGYTSLTEIPGKVDLVVAFVPATVVPDISRQCIDLGIKCLAVPSAGFSEFGDEGRLLERELLAEARDGGLRIIGPNCLGVINAENGLCLPFILLAKREPGTVSVISQSGGVGLSFIMLLGNARRSFNKFISVGNKLDMDEVDFLKLLAEDPGTNVICMFLEDIKRGREFAETASGIKKPILLCKASRTDTGSRAAASHTSSLANDDSVIEGIVRQAGIIRVDSIREMACAATAFDLPPCKGDRIVVMSQAGGYSVILADACARNGFKLPELDATTRQGLKERARADVINFRNPLDLGDMYKSDAIVYALDSILSQSDIHGVIVVLFRRSDSRYDGAFSGLAREVYGDIGQMMGKHNKPVALTVLTQGDYLSRIRSENPFPIFEAPEDALLALKALRDYGTGRSRV